MGDLNTTLPSAVESPFGTAPRRSLVREVGLADIDDSDLTFQYRPSANVRDLKVSLSFHGQKQPVDLWGRKPHRILDGFRRIEALKELGRRSVQAILHEGLSEAEAHRIAFVKNVVRKNLSPTDRANAIHQARMRGRTRAEIADDFDLSEKQVRRYEALLNLPKGLLALVEKGELSMAHARVLADAKTDDWPTWVQRLQERRWSAEFLKQELRRAGGGQCPESPRLYLKRERDLLRVYSFTIGKDAPEGEKAKVASMLREAAEFLEGS